MPRASDHYYNRINLDDCAHVFPLPCPQADVFRHRHRATIYSFASEDEMLTWLSVFNQAVAAVVLMFGIDKVGGPAGLW